MAVCCLSTARHLVYALPTSPTEFVFVSKKTSSNSVIDHHIISIKNFFFCFIDCFTSTHLVDMHKVSIV